MKIRLNHRWKIILTVSIFNVGCSWIDISDSSSRLADLKNKPVAQPNSATVIEDDTQEQYEKILKQHSQNLDNLYYEEALKRAAQLALINYEDNLLDDNVTQNDQENSILLFETWLKSNPQHPDASAVMYLLAKNYSLNGDLEKSESILQKLITQYPSASMVGESHFRLAESAYIRRQYDKAAFHYQKSIELENNIALTRWAFYMLGWTEYKRNLIEQSIKAFGKYIDSQLQDHPMQELSKSDQETVNDVIRALSLQIANASRSDLLIKFYQENISENTYFVFSNISDYLESVERWYEGITVLKSYYAAFPEDKNAILARKKVVEIFEKYDQPQVVIKEKQDFVDFYSDPAKYSSVSQSLIKIIRSQYLLDLAGFNEVLALQNGNANDEAYKISINYYKIFVKDYPEHQSYDSALYNLSLLYFKLKKFDEALNGFESLRKKPNFVKREDCAILTIQARRLQYESIKNSFADSESAVIDTRRRLFEDYSYYIDNFKNGSNIQEVINAASILAMNHHQQDYLLNLIKKIDSFHLNVESTIAIHEQAADYFYKNSSWFRSIELYEKLIKNYSSFVGFNRWVSQAANAHFELAMQLKEQQYWDESLKHLFTISEKYPAFNLSSSVVYQIALVYREKLQYEHSNIYLNKIKDQPVPGATKADLYLLLADNALKAGDSNTSAHLYKQYSAQVDSQENKIAALQKSAELYKNSNNIAETANILEELLLLKKSDIQESIIIKDQLINYYVELSELEKADQHAQSIVNLSLSFNQPATVEVNMVRSKYVLNKAKYNFEKFNAIKITVPIEQSFNAKYAAINQIIDLLEHIKNLNISPYQYEAEFLLGDLFYRFAQDLLHSEIPPNMTEDEALEYQALLEEQAYPFEEKAIDIFKANFAQIKSRSEDEWIILNRQRLEILLPALFLKNEKMLSKFER